MFIPQTVELEKGMLVSYDTIVAKKKELEGKQVARKSELQADAIDLLREFKKSLALPDEYTVDYDDRKIPYVAIFIKNNHGLYEQRSPHGLQTNESFQLTFFMGLMVNAEVPGGEWIYIPVEMWYDGRHLIVTAGREQAQVRVHDDKSNGRFFDVAAMIKKSFIGALTDPRLE